MIWFLYDHFHTDAFQNEVGVSVSMHNHIPQIDVDIQNPHFVCIHNNVNIFGSDIGTLSLLPTFDSTTRMIHSMKNDELQGITFIIHLAFFYKNHFQDLKLDKTSVDQSIFVTRTLLNVKNKFDIEHTWQIDFENNSINLFYQLQHLNKFSFPSNHSRFKVILETTFDFSYKIGLLFESGIQVQSMMYTRLWNLVILPVSGEVSQMVLKINTVYRYFSTTTIFDPLLRNEELRWKMMKYFAAQIGHNVADLKPYSAFISLDGGRPRVAASCNLQL